MPSPTGKAEDDHTSLDVGAGGWPPWVLATAGLPQARTGTAAMDLASPTALLYVIAGAGPPRR
ncbi:hypothetical protein QFZ66_002019 [Streptomyces sp. B4I13]|nr:hypothetical protein [Streptomyces sp. B4I13]